MSVRGIAVLFTGLRCALGRFRGRVSHRALTEAPRFEKFFATLRHDATSHSGRRAPGR